MNGGNISSERLFSLLNELRSGTRKTPLIMGVLNVTPDSFYDGGRYYDRGRALEHALEMEKQGADILDIGGESTRPGSQPLSEKEEIARVVPIINEIRGQSHIPISIDTYKSVVANAAVEAGADMINDISGMTFDPSMIDIILKYRCPVCIMHIKGTPRNMQENPFYEDVVGDVFSFLKQESEYAISRGVNAMQIIIDPGIGFGKRVQDNVMLMRNLGCLKSLGFPVLIGVSRKSFINSLLNVRTPQDRLGASLSAQLFCARQGADILRTHDVKETIQSVSIYNILERSYAF